MCGIFGIYSRRGVSRGKERAQAAVKALAHRGGDGWGIETGASFSLAHTRLSFVDLSDCGAQPMWDAERQVCLTFNGEIYNHRNLRRSLQARGYAFTGSSDTEVLLAGYLLEGLPFIERIRGMFAFGIYDARDDSCLVVRDRIGIKPVYYRWNGAELVFASEPPPLNDPPYSARFSGPGALSSFLAYRSTLGEDTLLAGVKLLQPGCWLKVTGPRIDTGTYWTLAANRFHLVSDRDWVNSFEAVFERSVAEHSMADVPVGILLSGGLDSSMILAALPADRRTDVTAFAARLNEPTYDETPYAEMVAQSFRVPLDITDIEVAHHEADVDRLIAVKGFPLSLHNEVAMARLARRARGRYKAVMSGEGADEIVGGYGRLARIPFSLNAQGHSAADHDACIRKFLQNYGYFPAALSARLFRNEHSAEVEAAGRSDAATIRSCWMQFSDRTTLSALCATLTRLHLPILLQMVDSTSMSENLELRVPFADHMVSQLVLASPDRLKLGWRYPGAQLIARQLPVSCYSERLDRTKLLYRKAFGKRLPDTILTRRKQGFPVPWGSWFAGPLQALVTNSLSSRDSPLWEIFDRGRVQGWLEDCYRAPAMADDVGKQLWMLASCDRWMRALAF